MSRYAPVARISSLFLVLLFPASLDAFLNILDVASLPCQKDSVARFVHTLTAVRTNIEIDLSDKVAVVTGGSRGIGKGIALELGACGATVYVIGRSSRKDGVTTDRLLGDTECTVERTVEEIGELGGTGIPVVLDVDYDQALADLMKRVQTEQGRLDVLVCSAFATPPNLNKSSFRSEFWTQGAPMWDATHQVGLRSMYIASCEAVPIMQQTVEKHPTSRPIIALISSFGGKSFTFNVAYGVGKAATDRLASDMSLQLKPYNIDTVSLYPGIVKTEGNLEMERRGEWAAASGGLDLDSGETPRFTGRALTHLLANPDIQEQRSGKEVVVAELAKELGFMDVDGQVPASIRSLRFILPNFVFPQIEEKTGKPLPSVIKDNVPDILLPWSTFSEGPPPSD